jgi:diphthine-ammonia ligase
MYNQKYFKNIEKREKIISNKVEIISELSLLLNKSIQKLPKKIAIAFSGGIDSSLIAFLAQKNNIQYSLYTIGFEDSKDVIAAKETAKQMNWNLTVIPIRLEECEDIFKQVIKITKKRDPITVGVGAVTLTVLKNIKEKILITGLGSEEIFAGYERHKENTNEECWKGLQEIWERDLVRAISLAKHFNKQILLPFLDKELIEYAMQIDETLKIQEYKKQILRETALHLGLPENISFRKKCAAQYGSKFDYALEKLAKQNKMKKKEYLLQL